VTDPALKASQVFFRRHLLAWNSDTLQLLFRPAGALPPPLLRVWPAPESSVPGGLVSLVLLPEHEDGTRPARQVFKDEGGQAWAMEAESHFSDEVLLVVTQGVMEQGIYRSLWREAARD